MNIKIELNEKDIAEILKQYYNSNKVNIYAQKDIDGYGPMEHEVTRCRAEIIIDDMNKISTFTRQER